MSVVRRCRRPPHGVAANVILTPDWNYVREKKRGCRRRLFVGLRTSACPRGETCLALLALLALLRVSPYCANAHVATGSSATRLLSGRELGWNTSPLCVQWASGEKDNPTRRVGAACEERRRKMAFFFFSNTKRNQSIC